jgi:hypothetical protein
MPFRSLVQKPEYHSIEWLREEAFKHWDRALDEMSVSLQWNLVTTYLLT